MASTNGEESNVLKTCSNCNAKKAEAEFPKKGAQCKACIAKKAADAYAKKHSRPAKTSGAARHIAGTFNGSGLMILHFEDGVRIGPITVSAAGVAQMPHHVDLTAAQLNELVAWWKSRPMERAE